MINFEMHVLSQCEILLGIKYEVSRIIEDIEKFNSNDEATNKKAPLQYSLDIGLIFFIIKIKWGI